MFFHLKRLSKKIKKTLLKEAVRKCFLTASFLTGISFLNIHYTFFISLHLAFHTLHALIISASRL